MIEQFSRTTRLLGIDAMNVLQDKKIAVFGLGGVGGYVVEALARSGVSHFILVDNDIVSESNLNRQILATHSTLGCKKVDVAKVRILDINPMAQVETYDMFYLPDNAELIDLNGVDYIVDAIDTMTAKINLVERAKSQNISIISCMGTGNKLDATAFKVADIFDTKQCPVAKVMRKELRDRGITSLQVVYSEEPPIKICVNDSNNRHSPASVAWAPSVAGLIMASKVILDLTNINNNQQ